MEHQLNCFTNSARKHAINNLYIEIIFIGRCGELGNGLVFVKKEIKNQKYQEKYLVLKTSEELSNAEGLQLRHFF
jgi:hypothetical protein